jgi:Leucine-rich repeat (LRR) protein
MEGQYQYDVFLSHSSKDKKIADRVCEALEAQNIKCWIAPRDIVPGSEWGESIIEAIHGSRIMVLVFSSASNHSKQVARELESAIRKNLYIIPFRVENVDPTGSMEYYLYTQHWLDAFTAPMEKHIEKLVSDVGDYLKTGKPDEPVIAKSRKATVRQKPKSLKNRWVLTGIAMIAIAALTITSIWLANGTKNRANPNPGTNLQTGNMNENNGLLTSGGLITPLPSPEGISDKTKEPTPGTAPEKISDTAAQEEGSSRNTPSGQSIETEITQAPVMPKQPEQASASGSDNGTGVNPLNTPIPENTGSAALSEGNSKNTDSGGGNVSPTPDAQREPAGSPKQTEKPIFDDKKLEAVIREALGKPTGDITLEELAGISELDASMKGILSINALQYMTNLEKLEIYGNEISDLTPLKSLVRLREIYGYENKISSLKPVGDLKSLQKLYMCWNSFTDLSPLSGLSNLRELSFGDCGVSDISPLAGLTQLEILRMYDNNITNLSPLSGMTNLQELRVTGNPITDFTPVERLNIPELIRD